MAQSSSSSTTDSKIDHGVVCNCNQPAKIVKAWTKENPGRRFYSCRGRKVANGYESCNFFRWFDIEKPHGWQNLALLEVSDLIRQQKEEIRNLKNTVRALTHEGESMENFSELMDKLKQKEDKCEALKCEVLILKERSAVFRNVLITSSIGFAVVIGGIITLCK